MQRYADNTPSLSKELHSERKKRIRKLTSNYYGFQKNLKQGLLNSNSTSVIKPTKILDSSVFKQRPDGKDTEEFYRYFASYKEHLQNEGRKRKEYKITHPSLRDEKDNLLRSKALFETYPTNYNSAPMVPLLHSFSTILKIARHKNKLILNIPPTIISTQNAKYATFISSSPDRAIVSYSQIKPEKIGNCLKKHFEDQESFVFKPKFVIKTEQNKANSIMLFNSIDSLLDSISEIKSDFIIQKYIEGKTKFPAIYRAKYTETDAKVFMINKKSSSEKAQNSRTVSSDLVIVNNDPFICSTASDNLEDLIVNSCLAKVIPDINTQAQSLTRSLQEYIFYPSGNKIAQITYDFIQGKNSKFYLLQIKGFAFEPKLKEIKQPLSTPAMEKPASNECYGEFCKVRDHYILHGLLNAVKKLMIQENGENQISEINKMLSFNLKGTIYYKIILQYRWLHQNLSFQRMKTQDYALFLPFFMGKDILASRKFLANSYGSVALYESVPICGACHYLYNLYNSKVETAYSLSGAQDIILKEYRSRLTKNIPIEEKDFEKIVQLCSKDLEDLDKNSSSAGSLPALKEQKERKKQVIREKIQERMKKGDFYGYKVGGNEDDDLNEDLKDLSTPNKSKKNSKFYPPKDTFSEKKAESNPKLKAKMPSLDNFNLKQDWSKPPRNFIKENIAKPFPQGHTVEVKLKEEEDETEKKKTTLEETLEPETNRFNSIQTTYNNDIKSRYQTMEKMRNRSIEHLLKNYNSMNLNTKLRITKAKQNRNQTQQRNLSSHQSEHK